MIVQLWHALYFWRLWTWWATKYWEGREDGGRIEERQRVPAC